MTLQREQIDTLLAEIDGVLSKANPRLPWVMSSEVTQQRQTLERIRHYLKGLQSDPVVSSLEPAYQPWGDLIPRTTNLEVSTPSRADWIESADSPQAALNLSQQMMQAFTQDLAQLRSSFLQPLQAETTRLQQQRDSLLQEVRQLERQRQQHSLIQQRAGQEQQVYEFLQGLMDRLQERLSQQINQMVGTIAAGGSGISAITPHSPDALVLDSMPGGTPLFPAEAGLPPLAPAQRVEQLQMLQARADQIMVTLDTTLRAFAEALQQNIQSYESSLNQGLEKMHTMGQQGEAIVANLVQKLADQVSGQVVSGSLPSSASAGSRTPGFSSQGFNAALPDRQHFTTYTSPESDRTVNRFKLSGNAAPSVPTTPVPPSVSAPAGQYASPSKTVRNPEPKDNSPADLPQTELDPAQTDLELDLELLEQLEQSSGSEQSEPTELAPSDFKSEEPQAGNEELDAFYASLFGDTNRKPGSVSLDVPQPSDSQAPAVSSNAVGIDAVGIDSVAIDAAVTDFDPLAEDLDDEAVELLDLELEAEDSSEAGSAALPHSEAGRSATTSPDPRAKDWESSSMDPLAALSLNLQAFSQGVTEIGTPVQEAVLGDTASEDTLLDDTVLADAMTEDPVTDPLMADLEEALQSFDAPDLSPSQNDIRLAQPSTIVETPRTERTQPVSAPEQLGTDAIPAEDIISTLTDLLVSNLLPTEGITPVALQNDTEAATATTTPLQQVNPTKSLIPVPTSPPSDPAFEEAGPEESLLVQEEVEGSTPMELYLEPETLHQLKEDLSKLENQLPEDVENFFDFGAGDSPKVAETADPLGADPVPEGTADHLPENPIDESRVGESTVGEDIFGEDIFGEDIFGAEFGDSIPAPESSEPSQSSAASIAPPLEEEDLWEASSPEESLLPEAEDHSLDWLAIQTEPTPEPRPSTTPPVSSPNLSFDLLANSAFGGGLEEDLDLDSSFEEDNELSLDRMTDWFAEEPDTPLPSTEPDAEDSLLIDHLFSDLPDAEKKNDWRI